VPESKDEHEHKAFDVAGAITVTGGLVALVYGIVKAEEKGWLSLHTLGFGALAAVLLGSFLLIEHRSAEPLVRLGFLVKRTIRSANVVMLMVAAGLFAMFYFNSLYVQRVLGYSPIEAGAAFVAFTIGIVIGAGLSQTLVRTIGLRSVAMIGLVLGTAGMLLLLRLDVGGNYWTDLLPSIMIMSIGMGMTFVPVTLIATSGIDAGDAGLASGLLNTSQQIGGALGLAILSTLATTRTTNELESVGGRPSQEETGHALVQGFHVAYLFGAIFLAAGAVILALTLKRSDVEQIDVEEPAQIAA